MSSRAHVVRTARPLAAAGMPDRGAAPLDPTSPAAASDPDRDLRAELRVFAVEYSRGGGIAGLTRCWCVRGTSVTARKIQRLWREEGLRVPVKRRKRQRLGVSTTPADRLHAERPDHVWALDYQFDVTSTGRTIRVLHVVDEHTRESLADVVAYSIDADATVNALDRIVADRGASPAFIRCDNGPELTANALRDWCRGPPTPARATTRFTLAKPVGRVLRITHA